MSAQKQIDGVHSSCKFFEPCAWNLNHWRRSTLKEKVYRIPSLSLNTITKNSKEVVQKLLNSETKHKNNVILWHDTLNISVSRHKNKGTRFLSVSECLAILKQLENRLRALVYCKPDWTPNIVEELKRQSITVWHVKKDFVFSRKQNDQEFMKQFRVVQQSPEFELQHLHILLRNDCDTQHICSKHPSKRAQKAWKNASPVSVEE